MPSIEEEREKSWKDLDLTKDEAERFTNCFKDEEFRKLFCEYAEEIANPENKAKYEMEIKQLEADRGVDCEFIHPHPGYVLKTVMNGETKCFINICENDKIGKPSSQMGEGEGGRKGLQWSIPHSLAPPRDDFDKNKVLCQVIDCVFHPDTLRMALKNAAFKQMINSTALDSVAEKFSVTLDRANVKTPKMNYKGQPTAAVIRKANSEAAKKKEDGSMDPIQAGAYPPNWKMPGNENYERKSGDTKSSIPTKPSSTSSSSTPEFTTPNYKIIHRKNSDIKDFAHLVEATDATRPDELVVEIDVPLVKSAKHIDIDILQTKLVLKTDPEVAKYQLELKLPYPVNEDRGSAKFDKQKRKLTLTLPVIERKSTEQQSTD